MNQVLQLWEDLHLNKTKSSIFGFWETKQNRIIRVIQNADSNFDIIVLILYRLVKNLNYMEKYSSVYYIYQSLFLPIQNNLPHGNNLLELKFEFARALHHRGKYQLAKNLFNELSQNGFDIQRIEPWWNQSLVASQRDKVWVKLFAIPFIGQILLIIIYILVFNFTQSFLISTLLFIGLALSLKWYLVQFWINIQFHDFIGIKELPFIRMKVKKMFLLDFSISLLVFPLFYVFQGDYLPYSFLLIIWLQVFHFYLKYSYLPNQVGKLNRIKYLKK